MFLALSSFNKYTLVDNKMIASNESVMYTSGSILLYSLINFLYVFNSKGFKNKLKYIITTIGFVIVSIGYLIFMRENGAQLALSFIFFAFLIFGRVYSVILNFSIRSAIRNALTCLILVVVIMSLSEINRTLTNSIAVVALFVLILSFLFILKESFSRLQFNVLGRIIRNTFASEIIFGLVCLIITFAYILTITDGLTYGDSLWYCFALVTTIGFGDVTVASVAGRIVSVILGIYGIIVVAVITSIIVNFYTETKQSEISKELKQIQKEENKKNKE